MQRYDVIIIGSGTAGQSAAYALAAEGYTIALIEKSDTPGGVCALRGCQAKKWFYEVAETIGRCSHLQDIGLTTLPQIDWEQILQEKNAFTASVPVNTVSNLRGNGITFIKGDAQFINQNTLLVGDTAISARYFIVATGAGPAFLPVEGSRYLVTSDDFLELAAIPNRIAFIGGGFVSFEFAHFAARLGSKRGDVHILERHPRPLKPFDADMVAQLVKASEVEGITIHTDIEINAITQQGGEYHIELKDGKVLVVDLVVNGAGRTPDIDFLNLEKAGIAYDRKGITVGPFMETSQPHIFAIGDCAATVKLARVADREARVAADTIVAIDEKSEKVQQMNYDAVPAVLFTYPQLGMVGKTEEVLKEEGVTYWKSFDTQLRWPTYRRIGMNYAAYKILVDKHDRILGAHILSDNATGVLNTFKQAMIDKTPISKLRDDNIMAPYPSRESDIIYMLNPLLE